ncbi:MAG: hypothetical protein RL385_1828 [Pseudomonadota bacterium]|jgi:hypothetical protein
MSSSDPIDPLLALAKRAHHGASARRDAASFDAFEARLMLRRSRWRHSRYALAAAVCALALAVGLGAFAPAAPAPLAYQVARGVTEGAPDHPSEVSRLDFSDGSRVALGRESTASVRASTAHGASLVLARGTLDAAIVPRAANDWWFEAGPYRVHVTGTAFALTWSPDTQRFEIRMRSGRVTVTGPLAEQGISLGAGEQLVATPAEDHLEVSSTTTPVVSDGAASPDDAGAAATPEASAPRETPKAAPTARTHSARGHAPSGEEQAASDLVQLVSAGKFEAVLQAAERRGIRTLLRSGTLADLSAVADAARYAGQKETARRVLGAVRTRFPEAPDGRAAAYFLARVSEDADAAGWYERYLKEQPQGPYAAAALGALMAVRSRREEHGPAVEAARAYLKREPTGPYAGAARAILARDAGRGSASEAAAP